MVNYISTKLSNDKKITEELDKIKDYLTPNKLQNINLNPLELTEIVEASVLKTAKKEKTQVVSEALNKDVSIEKLVVKLLELELKKWLDKNLPSIVKEVVDKEIKRIIPKNE